MSAAWCAAGAWWGRTSGRAAKFRLTAVGVGLPPHAAVPTGSRLNSKGSDGNYRLSPFAESAATSSTIAFRREGLLILKKEVIRRCPSSGFGIEKLAFPRWTGISDAPEELNCSVESRTSNLLTADDAMPASPGRTYVRTPMTQHNFYSCSNSNFCQRMSKPILEHSPKSKTSRRSHNGLC